jgi:hypothetical protein
MLHSVEKYAILLLYYIYAILLYYYYAMASQSAQMVKGVAAAATKTVRSQLHC